ncbi:MAG: ABC transporter substrate-binding protein [Coriobacteriia bacterium]|nr:ABC transporter substrate-binding protein [Coriobacteriia bacterium]
MKKQKIIAILVSALMLGTMLSVVSCQSDSGNGTTAGGTILLGGTLSETGAQSALDAPAIQGIQIAVDKVNADGGINGQTLEFQNIDSKSDAIVATNVTNQLVGQGAVAIITSSNYDVGGASARAAQDGNLVGLSPACSSQLFGSAILGDKQFTLASWDTTMASVIATQACSTDGQMSAYVITDDSTDQTKSFSNSFVTDFHSLGGTVVLSDDFSQGSVDTATLIKHYKTLAQPPSCIFLSINMPDLGTVVKDFRAAGINVPIYGGDSFNDPALVGLLGATLGNGITWVSQGFASEDAAPGFNDFNTAYKAKFGQDVTDPTALSGYDAVMVIAQSLRNAGGTDGASLAKYMEVTSFQGLTGTISWSDAASGHVPSKTTALVKMESGQSAFVSWIDPGAPSQP